MDNEFVKSQIIRVFEEILEMKEELPIGLILLKVINLSKKEKVNLEDLEDNTFLDILVDIEADLGIHGTSNFI